MGERQHLPLLDGWRGIAILAVLVGHFFTSGTIFYSGRLGVELFFVLSGRLMAELLFVQRTPVTVFYIRRAARILPALLTFIVILIAASAVMGWPASIGDAVGALLFVLNYTANPDGNLAHIWSVCIEVHAYLVLGILAWLTKQRAEVVKPALLAIAILSMLNGAAQTLLLNRSYYAVYWRSDVRAASIFVAAAIYLYMRGGKPAHWSVPLVAGCLGGALQYHHIPDPIKYTIGTTLLSCSIATIEAAPGFAKYCLSSAILMRCGLLSYSLYLWQQPLYIAAGGQPLLSKLLLLATAATIAIASFHCIERPARRAIGSWTYRVTAAQAASHPT